MSKVPHHPLVFVSVVLLDFIRHHQLHRLVLRVLQELTQLLKTPRRQLLAYLVVQARSRYLGRRPARCVLLVASQHLEEPTLIHARYVL